MRKLAGVISEIIIDEYGSEEYIKRLSDPFFFQAFGSVLAFDWHSSGLTTTVCGALKESLNRENSGIKIAGGKGNTSRKTPEQILQFGDEFGLSSYKIDKMVYSSRMTAKVDNSLIQCSPHYQLYHHSFVFTEDGKWAVIQQGKNERYARRYHWLSDNVNSFVLEPGSNICGERKEEGVLDMTAKESEETQEASLDLVRDNPRHIEKYVKKPEQKTLSEFSYGKIRSFTMSPRHTIIDMDKRNVETLKRAYEIQPKTYEELIAIKGVGAKTIRGLALVSELVYGTGASWKDPVKFSFAYGGKDGIPRPVDKKEMDESTQILRDAVRNAKIGDREKLSAIKRLNKFI